MPSNEAYMVVGGCGFLGRHIVEMLLARGEQNVSVFDIVQRHFDRYVWDLVRADLKQCDFLHWRPGEFGGRDECDTKGEEKTRKVLSVVWRHLRLPYRLARARCRSYYLRARQRLWHAQSHRLLRR
jgi:nucleoside-diphosphate-sugar epimerase